MLVFGGVGKYTKVPWIRHGRYTYTVNVGSLVGESDNLSKCPGFFSGGLVKLSFIYIYTYCLIYIYTRWWFQIFFIFTPKIGEDEPILTSIFFKGVGSTTNYYTYIYI